MTRYQSKRDRWAVALILFGALAPASASMMVFFSLHDVLGKVLAIVACLAISGIALSFLLWTYYDLGGDTLVVRHGPLRWKIPLGAIRQVSPARNFLSSAALSADRLRLRYGEGLSVIYISPADRAGFVQQLADMIPELELQEELLVHLRGA